MLWRPTWSGAVRRLLEQLAGVRHHSLPGLHHVDQPDNASNEVADCSDEDEGKQAGGPALPHHHHNSNDDADELSDQNDQHRDEVIAEELHGCSLRGVNLAVRVEPCGLEYYRINVKISQF